MVLAQCVQIIIVILLVSMFCPDAFIPAMTMINIILVNVEVATLPCPVPTMRAFVNLHTVLVFIIKDFSNDKESPDKAGEYYEKAKCSHTFLQQLNERREVLLRVFKVSSSLISKYTPIKIVDKRVIPLFQLLSLILIRKL